MRLEQRIAAALGELSGETADRVEVLRTEIMRALGQRPRPPSPDSIWPVITTYVP
jgi:hypothetical protein